MSGVMQMNLMMKAAAASGITFIGNNTVFNNGAGGTVDAVIPAHIADDLLIASVRSYGAFGSLITVPTGWTTLRTLLGPSNEHTMKLCWRKATGSGTAGGTWSQSNGNGRLSVSVSVYRGQNTTTPFGAESGTIANASSSLATIPALTLTVAPSLVAVSVAIVSTNTIGAVTGITQRSSVSNTTAYMRTMTGDTNGTVDSWSSRTVNVGADIPTGICVYEIRAA